MTVPRVVVLTGAGISAESGVPTFRDAEGLWEGHRVEDVATPEAYELQPSVVHAFYDARRAALAGVEPNPAHRALAALEAAYGDVLLVVTQNIDDLHERAGATRVLHMHGELRSALCRGCGRRYAWDGDLGDYPPCPGCGETELRPAGRAVVRPAQPVVEEAAVVARLEHLRGAARQEIVDAALQLLGGKLQVEREARLVVVEPQGRQLA